MNYPIGATAAGGLDWKPSLALGEVGLRRPAYDGVINVRQTIDYREYTAPRCRGSKPLGQIVLRS